MTISLPPAFFSCFFFVIRVVFFSWGVVKHSFIHSVYIQGPLNLIREIMLILLFNSKKAYCINNW